MADIIVRIPKDQVAHFRNDKLASPISFWRFSNKPKRLNVGDYIFFTRPEGVVAGASVTEITDAPGFVETLDPVGNWNATWKGRQTHLFDPPLADIQYAQQGYRYLTPAEQMRLRQALKYL